MAEHPEPGLTGKRGGLLVQLPGRPLVISSAGGQLVRCRLWPKRPSGQDEQLGPGGRPVTETSVAAVCPAPRMGCGG